MTTPPIRSDSLQAGVARSDITIDSKDARVHDRLYAKALVLDDGATRLALIAMDAVAIGGICDIPDDFLPRLRARIVDELGIDGDHIVVHATHTHPPDRILCDDPQQVERTLDAVRRASQNLQPVSMGVGSGIENRIAINRILRTRDGGHWTMRQAHPCPPDDEIAALGPLDPQIGVLRFDRLDGRPLAVVFNYACHPLIGVPGGHVTANYPGFASALIEDALGHDAMALFIQGAAGDVTELLYKDNHQPRDATTVGHMLGHSTLAAWSRIATAPAARLKVISQTIALPRRTDQTQRIEALRQEQARLLTSLRFTSLNLKSFVPLYIQYALNPRHPADYAYRYMHEQQFGATGLDELDKTNRQHLQKYIDNVHVMERLARIEDAIATHERHRAINDAAGQPTIQAQVQGIRIGDAVLITAPIEVLTEVGLNIKRASPFAHTFIAAFSNGYMHYGPPAADYDKGSYEVTECFLAPEWQQLFEHTIADILQRL